MAAHFEELGWRQTPAGVISLRRRTEPTLKTEVYEVKLDDEFLMSSLFTAGEVALAQLGLAQVAADADLQVVVGGLGLGYTAQAVLDDTRLGSLIVVEALDEVIAWHKRELVPCAARLNADRRCRMVHGDFFALTASVDGFDPQAPGRRVHAILADIDHCPGQWLHPSHSAFYTAAGLTQMATHLLPGGIFALWSNDPPDEGFTGLLRQVFTSADTHVVSFANPLQGRNAANTVYVASAQRQAE